MSTFKSSREVYESARDSADTIRRELEHYPDDDVFGLIHQEAERQCIYTQDNWDVVNLMRFSDEMGEAEDMAGSLGGHEGIDSYMTALAFYIWEQLITEEVNK